jgi:hypothetical protein
MDAGAPSVNINYALIVLASEAPDIPGSCNIFRPQTGESCAIARGWLVQDRTIARGWLLQNRDRAASVRANRQYR